MGSRQMACDLEAARITSLPADAFYISDFISEDEEDRLLQRVSRTFDVCVGLFSMVFDARLWCSLACHLFVALSSYHSRMPGTSIVELHADDSNR